MVTASPASVIAATSVFSLPETSLLKHESGVSAGDGLEGEIAVAPRNLLLVTLIFGAAERDVHPAGVALKTNHYGRASCQLGSHIGYEKVAGNPNPLFGAKIEANFPETVAGMFPFNLQAGVYSGRVSAEKLAELAAGRFAPLLEGTRTVERESPRGSGKSGAMGLFRGVRFHRHSR
jgi:hypothetical protein